MRGTLHFASSQDLHWILKLLAPSLTKLATSRDRRFGLTDETIRKAENLFTEALEGNRQLTRGEMYKVLQKGGLFTAGLLGLLMINRAAWNGLICFGRHRGKQPTFVLLDEWIPKAKRLAEGQAFAELTYLYFASRGPATIQDYMWWSGLAASDASAGIEGASARLVSEEIDGKTYYMARNTQKPKENDATVRLLPDFDEYLVGYRDRFAMLGNADTQRILRSGKIYGTSSNALFLPVIVPDGKVVGIWKRRNEKEKVILTLQPFMKLEKEQKNMIKEEAERYGTFLEAPIEINLQA